MANEKRLIDGDKLRGLKYEKTKFSDYREGWNDAIDTICTELFAPAVEVVHGRWEKFQRFVICSNCDAGWPYYKNDTDRFRYCPNCGAKMDGGNEDAER